MPNSSWILEKGGGEIQKQIKCPTCCQCIRWQIPCYEEAQEVSEVNITTTRVTSLWYC